MEHRGGDKVRPMPRKAKSEQPDLEQSLSELERIVEKMEKGEQTLEQSLNDFEKGMALAESSHESLKIAEQRVEKLEKKSLELEFEEFDDEEPV